MRLPQHDDVAGELRLHVETLTFLRGAFPSGEGTTQQRGSGHRGRHGHQHDDGVRAVVEHPERQADGGDHDLEGTTGVEADTERGALPQRKEGELGAEDRAEELRERRDREHDQRPQDRLAVGEQAEIDPKAGGGEEDRGEDRSGHRLQRADQLMLGEAGTSEDHAGDEGAEHGLDMEPLGDDTERQGRDQHDRHAGELIAALGPHPLQGDVDRSLTDREGDDEEHDQADDGEGQLVELEATGLRETGDEAEGDPADHVVGHARCEGELAEVSTHQAHLAEDLGDHRQRRDRECRGDEQGEDVALGVAADEGHRDEPPDGESGDGRHDQRPGGDDHGSSTEPPDQAEVGLEAGADEQEQHAQPADGEQHAGLDVVGREHPVGDVGCELAQHRRAEDEAGGEFTDDRRLSDPLHQRPQQPSGDQDHQQGHPEDEQLVFGGGIQAHGTLRCRGVQGVIPTVTGT